MPEPGAWHVPMPAPSSVILHVENDADDIFLTQRALRKMGVTSPAPAVENGEQAVSYLLEKEKSKTARLSAALGHPARLEHAVDVGRRLPAVEPTVRCVFRQEFISKGRSEARTWQTS